MAPALIGRSASEEYATLRELFRPHVESFDYFLEKGLDKMLESIRPMEIKDPNSNKFLRISLEKGHVLPPMRDGRLGVPLYPQECRQARISYHGEFKVDVRLQCDDTMAAVSHSFNFGHLPIMLMVLHMCWDGETYTDSYFTEA
jgi:DNA-directed RNA polymerase I subunit RPA2